MKSIAGFMVAWGVELKFVLRAVLSFHYEFFISF